MKLVTPRGTVCVDIFPSAEEFAWTFGGVSPRWEITPGIPLTVFTEDCYGGVIRSTEDLPSQLVESVNPQTGPFFVKGAEPGDTIAVHLVDVAPARDWAMSCTVPLYGALNSSSRSPMLFAGLPERTWIYRLDAQAANVRFEAADSPWSVSIPLAPFHGTLGVAPADGEVRSSIVPDNFGGNMDSPEVRAGATVYLGVNVPGALLSIGDGHYTMGEGEACGSAVEGAMVTTLVVEVLKGQYCAWPRIETDEAIMVAGSARPLEDAFRIAHVELVNWVAREVGASTLDTYQVLSQCVRSRIANVVDPNYTIVAKLPKQFLPASSTWMNGAHTRLRRHRI